MRRNSNLKAVLKDSNITLSEVAKEINKSKLVTWLKINGLVRLYLLEMTAIKNLINACYQYDCYDYDYLFFWS